MNSCILMAQIVSGPELRLTPDEVEVTEMMVQFSGPNPKDPPANLKVVGWRNKAKEIKENYVSGDRVILQGRLSMNLFEHREGFKEKRAELIVSRIYKMEVAEMDAPGTEPAARTHSDNVVAMDSYNSTSDPKFDDGTDVEVVPISHQSEDDIPF